MRPQVRGPRLSLPPESSWPRGSQRAGTVVSPTEASPETTESSIRADRPRGDAMHATAGGDADLTGGNDRLFLLVYRVRATIRFWGRRHPKSRSGGVAGRLRLPWLLRQQSLLV